jgi:hypothetical protein
MIGCTHYYVTDPDPGIRDVSYLLIIEIFRSFLKVPILVVSVIEESKQFHAATPVYLINFVAGKVLVKGVLSLLAFVGL